MASSKTFHPHEYQNESIKFVLKNPAAGLLLPPGMGKTAIALAAFRYLKAKGIVDHALIIAPIRPIYLVWPAEIAKWKQFNDTTYSILHGGKKNEALSEDSDVYLFNPDGVKWLSDHVRKLTSKGKWMLIVDESSKFKNSRSKRFKMIKKWLNYFERRVIMTGTPAPNGLENLWSQTFMLDGGERLGKFITAFRNQYFYPSGYMGYELKLQGGAEQKIYDKIDDIVIHKGREELNMPGLHTNNIYVELPKSASKVYRDMFNEYLAFAKDELITAVNAAVMSGKLKQIAAGAVYGEDRKISVVHDAKIEALTDLVDSLEGRPLMVFYEFKHDLSRLQEVFKAPHIGGGVSPKEGKNVTDMWNAGKIPILLLHPSSAGHGLNLQEGGCTDVCWFSITWDQELHEQARDRVWRQGVDGDVTEHFIIAKDTIDERIMDVLAGKAKLQDEFLEAVKK